MKNRQQLRLEIAERVATLTAQQTHWEQQRVERKQQRRASLASPKVLAGSFAAGIALGLISQRSKRSADNESEGHDAPSPLLRIARQLLPVAQPLLVSAAVQWWQHFQHGDVGVEPTPESAPEL